MFDHQLPGPALLGHARFAPRRRKIEDADRNALVLILLVGGWLLVIAIEQQLIEIGVANIEERLPRIAHGEIIERERAIAAVDERGPYAATEHREVQIKSAVGGKIALGERGQQNIVQIGFIQHHNCVSKQWLGGIGRSAAHTIAGVFVQQQFAKEQIGVDTQILPIGEQPAARNLDRQRRHLGCNDIDTLAGGARLAQSGAVSALKTTAQRHQIWRPACLDEPPRLRIEAPNA
ncbi:hypothetical protein HC891_15065 [Candidatus Gracilibacteria bacterium]|nr:hypothetical protein [Candidatus Gracilibacteria bacterium]